MTTMIYNDSTVIHDNRYNNNINNNNDPPGTHTKYRGFGPKLIYDIAYFHRQDKKPVSPQDATIILTLTMIVIIL